MTKENLKQNAERLYGESLVRTLNLVGEAFEETAGSVGELLDPAALCREHSGADYSVEELQLMRVYKLVTQIAVQDALDIWRDVVNRIDANKGQMARESVGELVARLYRKEARL